MKLSVLTTAIAIALTSASAIAADNAGKPYVFGSIGLSRMDISEIEDYYEAEAANYNSFPGVTASDDSEDSDTSLAFGGGYQVNENVAFEVFYRNYGEVYGSVNATDGFDSAREKTTISAEGLGVGVIGMAPVSDSISLFFRLDLVNLKVEGENNYRDTFGDFFSGKVDDTNVKAGIGIGAQFNISNGFAVRADLQRIEAELEEEASDIDTVSLSLVKAF